VAKLPPGPERDALLKDALLKNALLKNALLKKARRAEITDQWHGPTGHSGRLLPERVRLW
jgi:hypothetical protein